MLFRLRQNAKNRMKDAKKHKPEGPGTQKTFGFLDKDTYFLAKEWLMKIYKQPARILRHRGDKK